MAKDNRPLGRFVLDGIPPSRRGIPQIEVVFDIDVNGILHVTANNKANGKSQNIRIEAKSGLSDDEIKRMKREAEQNADSDKRTKEDADKLNAADALIFQTESQFNEYKDKISDAHKKTIQTALDDLKSAHASKDMSKIDSAMSTLNTAWHTVSQEMYSDQGTTASAPKDDHSGTESKSGVEDVPFEEVK